MTDVEAKTPNKRRLSDKGEKKGPASAKKAKVTPKPQNKGLNKQNNVQNNAKFQKKNKTNSESENGSPKKLKPFVGTAKIGKPNKQQEKGNKDAQQDVAKSERKHRGYKKYVLLRSKMQSDEKEATLKQVEEKIKAMESRESLTKSGKRKLKMLYRLKRYATGESVGPAQQQKVANDKAGKKKGTEAPKALQSNVGKKEVAKAQAKGVQKKANEVNKKQVKVDSKQVLKKAKQPVKVVQAEESSDEDEESDDELNQEDESGSDEEVEEEDGGSEGEEEEDSDDQEGGEEESDEDEGEEEEEGDSDEDESEEDSPPPKVSNKKQKKK